MKKIIARFNCDCGCNSKFLPIIRKANIISESQENMELYLTIIQCEECGKDFVVQFDTEYTHGLLKRQLKYNHEIGTKRIKYGASSKKIKKIENKLKAISANLVNERNSLMQLYNNKQYIDENGEEKTINYHDFIVQLYNEEE